MRKIEERAFRIFKLLERVKLLELLEQLQEKRLSEAKLSPHLNV
jgi:hypothetical protein